MPVLIVALAGLGVAGLNAIKDILTDDDTKSSAVNLTALLIAGTAVYFLTTKKIQVK